MCIYLLSILAVGVYRRERFLELPILLSLYVLLKVGVIYLTIKNDILSSDFGWVEEENRIVGLSRVAYGTQPWLVLHIFLNYWHSGCRVSQFSTVCISVVEKNVIGLFAFLPPYYMIHCVL